MKKIKFSKLLAVLVVWGLFLGSILTAQVKQTEEQNPKVLQEGNGNPVHSMNDGIIPAGSSRNFMDENGNGMCDYFEQWQIMTLNMNRGMDHHRQYVDENGDGINDNFSGGNMHQNGTNSGSRACDRSGNNNGSMQRTMNHR